MANLADVTQQLKENNETQDFNLVQNALQLDDLRDSNDEISKGVVIMVTTLEQIRNNIIQSIEVQKDIFEMQTGESFAKREAELEAARKAQGDAGGTVETTELTSDDKQKGGMLGKLFGIMAGVGLIAALTASEEQLQAFGTFIKEKVVPGFKTLYEEGLKPFYESVIKPIIDWAVSTGLPAVGQTIVSFIEDIGAFLGGISEAVNLFREGDYLGALSKIGETLLQAVDDVTNTIIEGLLGLFGIDTEGQDGGDFLNEKFANFAEESKKKLMQFIGGLLPDPDSWIGRNLIPNSVYEALGLPGTTPQEAKPVIEAEETVDEFGDIGRDQPPAAPAPRATVSAEDPLAIGMESFTEGQRATTTAARQKELAELQKQFDRELELENLNQGATGRGGGRAELKERLIPAGEAAEDIPPIRFLSYHEAGYDVVKGQQGWQASVETPDGSTKTFYEDGSYTLSGVDGKAFFDAEGNLVKTQLPTLTEGLTRTQFADGTVENQYGKGPVRVTADEQGNVLEGSITFGGVTTTKGRDGEVTETFLNDAIKAEYMARKEDPAFQEEVRRLMPTADAARNKSLSAPVGQASTEVAAAASGPTVVAPQTTVAPVTNQSSVTNINNSTTVGSTSARPTEPSFMRVQEQSASF